MRKQVSITGLLLLMMSFSLFACQQSSKQSEQEGESKEQPVSPFRADSAYKQIEAQIAFGPRVPNTDGHKACAEYLATTLKGYGLDVHVQEASLKAYTGEILEARNIIASYAPERESRILLFAHWDTRHVADHDPNQALQEKPIDGADDGASGVAVLLELARHLNPDALKNYGVDILLVDAEDYGVPHNVSYSGNSETTWCLGTQYFAKHPYPEGYKAEFGILLDMVGAKGATFYREFFSQENAGYYTSLIWNLAQKMGYGKYFINQMGGAITDDHIFIHRGLGIPCVDILNYNPDSEKGFGDHWHTHRDNIEIIDPQTLQAVGDVVWAVLKEKDDKKQ